MKEWESTVTNFDTSEKIEAQAQAIQTKIDELVENEFTASFTFVEQSRETVENVNKKVNKSIANIEAGNKKAFMIGGISIGFAIFAAFFLFWQIFFPTRRLVQITHRLAQGEFDNDIPKNGSKEFRKLYAALSSMQTDLVQHIEKKQKAILEAEQQKQLEETQNFMQQEAQKREALMQEENEKRNYEKQQLLKDLTEKLTTSIGQVASTLNISEEKLAMLVKQMNQTIANSAKSIQEDTQNAAILLTEMRKAVDETNLYIKDTSKIISHKIYENDKISEELKNYKQEIENSFDNFKVAVNDISKITTIIAEVATQINLLSINASIEASRAGDTGKGFSVVAAEVKKLANKTSEEVKAIANMIQKLSTVSQNVLQSFSKMSQKNDVMVQSGKVLYNTVELHNSELVASLTQISNNIYQTSQNVNNLCSVLQTDSKYLQNYSHNLENLSLQLNNNTHSLNESVQKFKQDIAA
jgi:methyl-accepting chemotaxis protein